MAWTPRDVDRHSFYDVYVALTGAARRDEREWERTLYVVQSIINFGGTRGKGFKPRPLDDLYRKAFGRDRAVAKKPVMSGEAIARVLSSVATVVVDARN